MSDRLTTSWNALNKKNISSFFQDSGNMVTMNFCIWYDSVTIVSWAKFRYDGNISMCGITNHSFSKSNFTAIQNVSSCFEGINSHNTILHIKDRRVIAYRACTTRYDRKSKYIFLRFIQQGQYIKGEHSKHIFHLSELVTYVATSCIVFNETIN